MTTSTCEVPIAAVTGGPRHYFFGFYDVCPWDESGRYMLAHESDFIDRMPEPDDVVGVCVIDTERGDRLERIAETRAWNFQQGTRLQWIPGRDREFVYNTRGANGFGAVVADVTGRTLRELSMPIYQVGPDGGSALTFSYGRLQRLGGYGYAGIEDARAEDPIPSDDGIYRVDLETGAAKLLVSIAEVARVAGDGTEGDGHHYVTHVTWNPSGTRICFLHRFSLKDGGFYTRLMTADPDGSNLHCLSEGTLSHFDWFDDERILIWGRQRALVARARKNNLFALPVFQPLLGFLRRQTRGFLRQRVIGDRYLLLTDRSKKVESIGLGALTEDGHPTRFADSRFLLTDTYPDETHRRTLMLYDLERKRRIDVGRFYALPDSDHWVDAFGEGWETGGMRADLHPRWDRDQRRVCIDSIHEGSRQIYVLDATSLLAEP